MPKAVSVEVIVPVFSSVVVVLGTAAFTVVMLIPVPRTSKVPLFEMLPVTVVTLSWIADALVPETVMVPALEIVPSMVLRVVARKKPREMLVPVWLMFPVTLVSLSENTPLAVAVIVPFASIAPIFTGDKAKAALLLRVEW